MNATERESLPSVRPQLTLPILLVAVAVTAIGRSALVPSTIPRSIPAISVNLAILAFVGARLILGRWLGRPWSEWTMMGVAAALLTWETFGFLPRLYDGNVSLAWYYALGAVLILVLLAYGSIVIKGWAVLAILGVALGYEFLIALKMRFPVPLIYGPSAIATILVFVVLRDRRTISRQRDQVVRLYENERTLNEKLSAAGQRIVEQEKQAALASLTAGIAHEINNPVNFMSGNLQFLERDLHALREFATNSPEADQPFADADSILAEYRDGFDRISGIIDNLKQSFRMETGPRTRQNLSAILDTVITHLGLDEKGSQIFKKEYPETVILECVPSDMYVLASNLLRNALDAAGETGLVSLRVHRTVDGVVLSVQDTGPGIPAEQLDRVFDPFYSTKSGSENLGYGLTLCRSVVNKYSGSIQITCNPEDGTTVTAILKDDAGE